MAIVTFAPLKNGTPRMCLRRGGIIYLTEAAVNKLSIPCRMQVEMDPETGGVWLWPHPEGRTLARWKGKPGAYLQVRHDYADSPIPFDGRSGEVKVDLSGSVYAKMEGSG